MRKTISRGAAFMVALALSGQSQAQRSELEEGFRNPPATARPHVWWHWLTGNIDTSGAMLDLEWLSKIGVGGVHVFEAGMGTPTVVAERRIFMTPPWKAALKASAQKARSLGLDFGIATSGGWSATGGPWVSPENAMKKLVWSETEIEGGKRYDGNLPQPSDIAGPFQDVPLSMVHPGEKEGPALYRDARIIAIPAVRTHIPMPAEIVGAPIEKPPVMFDGKFGAAVRIDAKDGRATLSYRFEKSQTIRAVTVGLPVPTGFGTAAAPLARLEMSQDGTHYTKVADLRPTTSPVRMASFPAAKGKWFRLVLEPDSKPGFMAQLSYAPGAVRLPFGSQAPDHYDLSEFSLHGEVRVNHAAEQAGFASLPDYYDATVPLAKGIAASSVVDITDKMTPDGRLHWTPPKGRWRILRMGWSLTGHRNGPAPNEATGLEVDKLSVARVKGYLDHYLDLYRSAVGPDLLGKAGITSLLSDSIEAGPQNWTEEILDQFQRRRGYDPVPWLPALTGVVIGDAARTDAFLWDWRKTIADLYADAHYGTLAREAHKAGLSYYAEALEDHRPQLGDDMDMRAQADVPMGAMWTLDLGGVPKPTYVADIKGAASVGNIYGKKAVGAESLTAFGHPWAYAPSDLKATADLEFALGVNRLLIHTSPHQPLIDRAPGLALAPFLGQYFSRNEAWADMADGWISYLARTSYLLQQGQHVADIAYFYGEEAPITSLFGDEPPHVPQGYDYDFVNATALLGRFSVHNGRLETANGQSYRLLYLGGSSKRMTLKTLVQLKSLLEQGATVVGERPVGSPSLSDDPAAVSRIIDAIWGANDRSVRQLGQGRLIATRHLQQGLETLAVVPDWTWSGSSGLAVIHRRSSEGDIYFISNQSGSAVSGDIGLRIDGKAPEFWNADSGRVVAASYARRDGVTSIPLSLEKSGAIFILFRRASDTASVAVASPRLELVTSLDRNWRIRFQPERGAPAGQLPTDLTDWSRSKVDGIRHFSGVATYDTAFQMPDKRGNGAESVLLDLGTVKDVAAVFVNGQRAGVAWKAPYHVDISDLIRPGRNKIEVRLANLWVNRLIGDAQPDARAYGFTTGPTYRADAPLRPSGLLGPVRILRETRSGASE